MSVHDHQRFILIPKNMSKLSAIVFAILILSMAVQPANAGLKTLIATGAAGAIGVACVTFAPAALGFGAAGIVAGSSAAGWMSAAAIANGGGVAAGSAIAFMQSVGAVGLTATSALFGGSLGAGSGYAFAKVARKVVRK